MAKVTPITEHFQHLVAELKESLGGTCRGKRREQPAGWLLCYQSDNPICAW
jgi:hypothetical protein